MLGSHYKPKSCPDCHNELKPKITNETAFDPQGHNGIYENDPYGWYPHYDVEYLCKECDYYEHYTHDVGGGLKTVRINNVVFDVVSKQFCIMKYGTLELAGELPKDVAPFSEEYCEYFDSLLKKTRLEE
jgi:hypothetical protein